LLELFVVVQNLSIRLCSIQINKVVREKNCNKQGKTNCVVKFYDK
jgi:hypothetical protein